MSQNNVVFIQEVNILLLTNDVDQWIQVTCIMPVYIRKEISTNSAVLQRRSARFSASRRSSSYLWTAQSLELREQRIHSITLFVWLKLLRRSVQREEEKEDNADSDGDRSLARATAIAHNIFLFSTSYVNHAVYDVASS